MLDLFINALLNAAEEAINEVENAERYRCNTAKCRPLKVCNVIFNEPATIVFWTDGTKTVVKAAKDEPFDKEKGLAMAIVKKLSGNTGSYYDLFKHFIPELNEKPKKEKEPKKEKDFSEYMNPPEDVRSDTKNTPATDTPDTIDSDVSDRT